MKCEKCKKELARPTYSATSKDGTKFYWCGKCGKKWS